MLKVLHFYRTYYPDSFGGIEQVIRQLAVGTGRLGVQNSVLSLSRNPEPAVMEFEGHQIYRSKLNFEVASTGFSWQAISQFQELAAAADLIHYHFPWPFTDVVHFLSRVKKPTVLTYHSDIVRQKNLLKLYTPLKHQFLKDVTRIVATSPNYSATSPVLERYKDKTEVITLGLDKAIYPVPDQSLLESWRQQVGQGFFLFVGILRYYKGLHILLDAVAGTNIPVVIVGDGPEELELKAQAQKLGLYNVKFLGALPEPDKVALLQLCLALACPSHLRSEAFGISLLEAAMFGKPMISSEIGTGTTYINVANQTGLVVPPSDAMALRDAMQTLLAQPELATQMGRAAEQRFQDLFTAERMAENYMQLYQRIA